MLLPVIFLKSCLGEKLSPPETANCQAWAPIALGMILEAFLIENSTILLQFKFIAQYVGKIHEQQRLIYLIFDSESGMEKALCSVCCRSDEQIKVMLHFMRKRLKRISHEYIPDYRDQADSQPRHAHAFGRLLGIVMAANVALPAFQACPHEKFSRYLRRKLKCDNFAFNSLCNELINQIAKTNYQLEVLNIQLKTISETCLRLSHLPEAETVRSLDEQRREAARHTSTSLASQRPQARISESAFLRPMFGQYGGFAPMPVLYVSLGVNPGEMESQSLLRNEPN